MKLLAQVLKAAASFDRITDLYDLPKDVEQFMTFFTRNVRSMVGDIENSDPDTDATTRLNRWKTAKTSVVYSDQALVDAITFWLWQVLLVGRLVNDERVKSGHRTVNFYRAAKELDNEEVGGDVGK